MRRQTDGMSRAFNVIAEDCRGLRARPPEAPNGSPGRPDGHGRRALTHATGRCIL